MIPSSTSTNGCSLSAKPAQSFVIWLADDAGLGNDGRDQRRRRDVEGWMAGGHAFRRHTGFLKLQHLTWITLLDWNLTAMPEGAVEGGSRGGNVERNPVCTGQDRQGVGADLVGDVAVRNDAVGADDHGVDLTSLHHESGHAVGDERGGNLQRQ